MFSIAPRAALGLALFGLFLGVTAAHAQEAERAEKLKQAIAFKKQAEQLLAEKKLPEASAALTKAADLERMLFGKDAPEVAETLTLLGRLHQERDDWTAATKVQREVLAIRTRHGGAKHWQTTDARLALEYTELLSKMPAEKRALVHKADERYEAAGNLEQAGKFRDALKPANEAVAMRKQVLGETHPEVALALHRAGRVHLALAENAAAKSANEQALKIRLDAPGELHPDTGRSRLNLGNALRNLGDVKQAAKEYAQALHIFKKNLGNDHPLVLLALGNLASLLHSDLGNSVSARKYYEEALSLRRRSTAPDQLAIAANLMNLGNVLYALRDLPAARKHYEDALAIYRAKLPKDDPLIATGLNNLGNVLYDLRDLPAARRHYEDALAIRRAKLPKDDLRIATSLNNLGVMLYDLKDLPAARKHYEDALAIRRVKLPKDDPLIATSLNNLGAVLQELGDLPAARRHHEDALAIRRAKLPNDDPRIADSLNNLGNVLYDLRDLPAARRHHEDALAIRRAKLPKDDLRIATSLNTLGNVLQELDDLPAARKHYEDALAVRRAKLPKDDPRIADSLINLGTVLGNLGDLPAARKHLEEALAIRRAKLPKDDPRIADSLINLGIALGNLGDLPAARKHLEEALAIRRAKLPKGDFRILDGLNSLGVVLYGLGDLPAARKHLEDALAICRAKLPKDDPRIATSLHNLGAVLGDLGDLLAARKHLEEALAVRRAKLPKDDPLIANSLNNLGTVLEVLGDLPAARKHYEDALDIYRAELPKDDPRIATSLLNLGNVLRNLGDLPAARKHHEDALAIYLAKLSKDDPRIADSLHNLGNVLQELGDLPAARKHYEDALTIFRAKLPKDHPDFRYSLQSLMNLEKRVGNSDKSLAYREELTALVLARQERDALARSEREQLKAAANAKPYVDRLLDELLRAKRFEKAYDLTAASKGAVTARQRWLRFQRDFADERTAKLLEELRTVDYQLLHVGLGSGRTENQPKFDVGQRLQELTRRRDELERDLIASSPAFKAEKQRARRGLNEIAAALPDNAVLVDFVEYVPETRPARLGAFVVKPGPKIHWVDLGESNEIAKWVDGWRMSYGLALPKAKETPSAELRKLWEKIEPHVQGAKLVLLAPEGPLNGLPLAALPGRKAGSHLLEEYAFVNIPTPQLLPDLVGKTDPRFERPHSMLLLGDVDFGEPGEPFKRLTGTKTEINDIKDGFVERFPKGKLMELRKDKASKEAFAAESGKCRYLHLATHGTFADPSVKSVFAVENREGALRSSLAFDRHVVGEHPGLLSGIAFAGANRKDKKTEAILTALEVGEMELRGVELVVLSACDTGLGRVAGGEGVLGLQRAFQVAGARTTVTSLWKVDDLRTQQLMSRFYENLWDKKLSRVEALREAQLWMMREGNVRGLDLPADTKSLPPRYWAAFVLSGDWR